MMNKNTIPLTKERGTNLSVDRYGNAYFGIDADPQAIRIGMRGYAGKLGFPNSRGSASVPFMTLSQMSLMYIKGEVFDSKFMNELRKIGIAQTSMEGMVGKNQYDGVGFFIKWKSGLIPQMHYSSPKTHTSLSTDKMINPLNLPETIWWALMMSMLDIFDEQLGNYKAAIESLGIEATKDNFLEFIRKEYVSKINGNHQTATIGANNTSVFTLDDFPNDQQVFVFKNHKNRNGQDCCANTWYSQQECTEYLNINGCVWCRQRPNDGELEQVDMIDPNTKLAQMSAAFLPLRVAHVPSGAPAPPELQSISSAMANLSMSAASAGTNKYIIFMHGVTGCGKSTDSQQMKELINNNGGTALIVSSDKYGKRNIKGKQQVNAINKEIRDFDNSRTDKFKVVIMDLCNESGSDKNAFKFDFNSYESFDFFPQLNKDMIDDYEAWCLKNLISRQKDTPETSYWLNPIGAPLSTCIKVHNMKNEKFRMLIGCRPTNNNFRETDTMQVITEKVNAKAGAYANYLATINSHDVVAKFLSENNLLR